MAGIIISVAIWLPGVGWDALIGPTVDPSGLLAEPFDDAEQAEVQATLRRLAAEHAPDAVFETARVPAQELAVILEQRAAEAPDASTRDTLLIASARSASLAPLGAFHAFLQSEARAAGLIVDGVLSATLPDIVIGARVACWDIPRALWLRDPVFAVIFALWCVLTLAVGGGAISRMEAMSAAGREVLSARQGFQFAAERWADLVLAWLAPLGIAALLGLVCVLWGLLFRTSVGGWIGGALYVVPLLVGLVAGICIVVWLLGSPFAPSAVACDGLDAMDASQRGAIYAISRPGAWLFRLAIVLVVAGAGLAIARLIAWLVTGFTASFVSLGAGGAEFESVRVTPDAAVFSWSGPGVAIGWWLSLVSAIVMGAFFSVLFALLTRAYLSLRERCDAQPVTEIWPFEPATDVSDEPRKAP